MEKNNKYVEDVGKNENMACNKNEMFNLRR